MKVEVYDKNDKLICLLNEPERLLGSYPIDDGMRINVIANLRQNLKTKSKKLISKMLIFLFSLGCRQFCEARRSPARRKIPTIRGRICKKKW